MPSSGPGHAWDGVPGVLNGVLRWENEAHFTIHYTHEMQQEIQGEQCVLIATVFEKSKTFKMKLFPGSLQVCHLSLWNHDGIPSHGYLGSVKIEFTLHSIAHNHPNLQERIRFKKILDQNKNTTLILLLPEILSANADNASENRKLLVGRKKRESYQKGKCCSVFCLQLMWILGWPVLRDDLDTHLFSENVGNAGGKLKQHPAWQPLSFHGRFGLRNNEVEYSNRGLKHSANQLEIWVGEHPHQCVSNLNCGLGILPIAKMKTGPNTNGRKSAKTIFASPPPPPLGKLETGHPRRAKRH